MLSTIWINASKKPPVPEFRWTDDELVILLQAWVQYKSQQEYSVVNWGKTVRSKYEAIREIFVERITFSDGLSFIQSRFKSRLFGLRFLSVFQEVNFWKICGGNFVYVEPFLVRKIFCTQVFAGFSVFSFWV